MYCLSGVIITANLCCGQSRAGTRDGTTTAVIAVVISIVVVVLLVFVIGKPYHRGCLHLYIIHNMGMYVSFNTSWTYIIYCM